jgi:hypothetical protein
VSASECAWPGVMTHLEWLYALRAGAAARFRGSDELRLHEPSVCPSNGQDMELYGLGQVRIQPAGERLGLARVARAIGEGNGRTGARRSELRSKAMAAIGARPRKRNYAVSAWSAGGS